MLSWCLVAFCLQSEHRLRPHTKFAPCHVSSFVLIADNAVGMRERKRESEPSILKAKCPFSSHEAAGGYARNKITIRLMAFWAQVYLPYYRAADPRPLSYFHGICERSRQRKESFCFHICIWKHFYERSCRALAHKWNDFEAAEWPI